MPRIGPGRAPRHEIDLAKDVADNLVCFVLFTQRVQLRHDLRERSFDVADGALGIVFALRVETTLATNEFFPVEIGKGMKNGLALGARVSQEAR